MSKPGSVILGVVVVLLGGGYYAYAELGWFKAKPPPPPEKAPDPVKTKEEKARSEKHTTPDLLGLEPDAAKKALAGAGFSKDAFEIRADTACTYDSDADMKPQGTICSQHPSPGIEVSGVTKVQVVVEKDTYEEGNVGYSGAWKRMPDVTGMTKDEALEALQDKGFEEQEFEIYGMPGDCDKDTVCKTRPDPGGRKVRDRKGSLVIGG